MGKTTALINLPRHCTYSQFLHGMQEGTATKATQILLIGTCKDLYVNQEYRILINRKDMKITVQYYDYFEKASLVMEVLQWTDDLYVFLEWYKAYNYMDTPRAIQNYGEIYRKTYFEIKLPGRLTL